MAGTLHRPERVNEDLVQHEIAHVIHEQRHKGANYYCASDADLAVALLDLFNAKTWTVVMDNERARTATET